MDNEEEIKSNVNLWLIFFVYIIVSNWITSTRHSQHNICQKASSMKREESIDCAYQAQSLGSANKGKETKERTDEYKRSAEAETRTESQEVSPKIATESDWFLSLTLKDLLVLRS